MQRNKLDWPFETFKDVSDYFLKKPLADRQTRTLKFTIGKSVLSLIRDNEDYFCIDYEDQDLAKKVVDKCFSTEIPVDSHYPEHCYLNSKNKNMINDFLDVISSFTPIPDQLKEEILNKYLPKSFVIQPYKSQPGDVVNWYSSSSYTSVNLKQLHDKEEISICISDFHLPKIYGYMTFSTKNKDIQQDIIKRCQLLHLPFEEGEPDRDFNPPLSFVGVRVNDENVNDVKQFLEIIDDVTKSYGIPTPPIPTASEQIIKLAREATQEIATSAISHTFTSFPDHFVKVSPENEWTLAQKIAAIIADNVIYSSSRMMVNGDVSIIKGLAVCSTAAMTKGMILKDEEKGLSPKSYGHTDLEMIAKLSLQSGLTHVIQSQLEKFAQHISGHSDQLVKNSKLPLPLMFLLTGAFQQFRISGIPQMNSEEETTLQKVGHLVASAGIAASVGIMSHSPWLGAAGCATGIVANTLFGRKPSSSLNQEKDQDKDQVKDIDTFVDPHPFVGPY